MGKGDVRTRRGKINKGSFGKYRPTDRNHTRAKQRREGRTKNS